MSIYFNEALNRVRQQIDCVVKNNNLVDRNITLIAVSKTFPVEDILAFYDLGQRDFAENYIQEWVQKCDNLPEDIVWHMIGHVQSNKSKAVAQKADWLHTVDRLSLAQRLNQQRPDALAPLNICLEVNISQEAQKHGVSPEAVFSLADSVVFLPRLRLRGLMCVPKMGSEQEVRAQMMQMRELFLQLQKKYEGIDTLSMGMSADMDWAIECGATHIRIGSALFGRRDYSEK